jgi:hypothetical protein
MESDRHQGSVRLASQATTGKLAASERPFKTLWDRKGSWVVGYRRRWLYMCYSGRIAHICAEMGK